MSGQLDATKHSTKRNPNQTLRMIEPSKSGLRRLGIFFLTFLIMIGVGFSLGALLVMPLIRWAVHGVLYFSVSSSELRSLLFTVLGVTCVATAAMWLAGRNKNK